MNRAENWPALLAAFIEARRARAFCWGEHDCALMAADWVREATGADFAADLRGTYQTAAEAQRIVHQRGGLLRLCDDALPRHAAAAWAQRGDIVLAENDGRELLAVCAGHYAAAPGPQGLVAIAPAHWRAAWSV